MSITINHIAITEQIARLKTLHRSALPLAIRGTLNDAVYNVKTTTMPNTAKVFKKRAPNFFKANSKFEKATGFNTKTMKATVGFYENKLVDASKNYAVKDLEEQELGGKINKKSFIAQKGARMGNKQVRNDMRRSRLKQATFISTQSSGKVGKNGTARNLSLKQQFIRAAIYAESKFGKDAFVLGGLNKNGSRTLSLINEMRFGGKYTKGKYNFEMNRTAIYNVKKGRSINVKSTHFMKKASLESASKMVSFFNKQAEKQFARLAK